MKMSARLFVCLLATLALVSLARTRDAVTFAQPRDGVGRSIGTVTTQGDLIVMTLEEGELGSESLFDLEKRTLRFKPESGGYRGENLPLNWDPEFGTELTESSATLRSFTFPFSGQRWKELSVGVTGSIAFGLEARASGAPGRGGVSIGRFDQLQNAAPALVNTGPAICVFLKPRMSGTRYWKELPDRVVVTWSLTEPAGGIQDFTWVPTVNRFQAVLHRDGTIELSYDRLAARDAIVGIYPLVKGGRAREITAITDDHDPAAAAHLDITSVKLSTMDDVFLDVVFETRGPVPPEGDPASSGVVYQISFDGSGRGGAGRPVVWTVRGGAGGGRGGGRLRYTTSGSGVSPDVRVNGNTIRMRGVVPARLDQKGSIRVAAESRSTADAEAAGDQVPVTEVPLTNIRSPRVDLSAIRRQDAPLPVLYEAFHYVALPDPRDLTCTVINALGDRFDFLAYYSDFRIDNQEAGTPSTGPRGGGPAGGEVTGIASPQRGVPTYCSQGRFQWQFVQPVFVGSNQMQMYPPEGTTDTDRRNIGTYIGQLARRPDGRIRPYNYGISQIAHELGHRWSAFASARINGEVIPLGPTHWARGLHAPAAFPYQRPIEASAMGGGVWQDNFDGTFTQLDDDYYVPATGWSHLELYLMGLADASEVPDFFLLRNLRPAGEDAHGRPVFRAERTKITVADVIAHEGPRRPDVEKAQRTFNTGIVVIVQHGRTPSPELIERANGIREEWMNYFAITTGGRASTTTSPR